MKNLEQQLTPDPNQLYLQDLVIEQPKEKFELKFDPERDLTHEDLKNMDMLLNDCRQQEDNNSWWAFSNLASNMKVLGVSTDRLNLNNSDWAGMIRQMNGWREDYNSQEAFIAQAADMKILGANVDQLHIDEDAKKRMRERWEQYFDHEMWDDLGEQTMYMKLLGVTYDERKIHTTALHGMEEKLQEYHLKNNEWDSFAFLAIDMKLLGATYDTLHLDDTAWQGMTNLLNRLRKNNSRREVAEMARAMYILAAHKAEIKDGQIVIEKYPPKQEDFSSTQPLPPHRKF